MRILFTGCVESSFRLLEKLIQEGKDVAGVITKRKSAFNDDFHDLYPLCEKHGIPCHYTGMKEKICSFSPVIIYSKTAGVPFPGSLENIRALAMVRGSSALCRYAEAFYIERMTGQRTVRGEGDSEKYCDYTCTQRVKRAER